MVFQLLRCWTRREIVTFRTLLSDIVGPSEGGNMQPTGESTIQIKRRMIVTLILLPLFSGFAAFINIVGSPQFHEIRSLDVVRLIAIGACWGAAAVGLAVLIRSQVSKS